MIKIKYLFVWLPFILFANVVNASNDPFDWSLGEVFPKSIYWHEDNGGKTIRTHWDKSYSFLINRCLKDKPNRPGTYSTWRNKRVAYDRMKRTWRRSEADMVIQAGSSSIKRVIYRSTLFQSNEFGKLLRCSLNPVVRAIDYWASGTKKTRLEVDILRNSAVLRSGFPTY